MRPIQTVTVALTGASGLPYGLRLIDCLIAAGARVWVLYSQAAQVVAKQEMDLTLPSRPAEAQQWLMQRSGARDGQLAVFGREEWFAPVASGSNPADAMVVCPCSMGTLAAIAQGSSDNLIERAADVSIKEQRKLVLVPREAPFSAIHLENMLKLARLGVVILPPSPGFYTHPKTVDDMIDFVVARILDQLRIDNQLTPRWGEPAPDSPAAP
ncbi:flavin prenyltransferase UbiX [Chromobacterium haemolyticum]|uniref:flavin prenyltransferase UbiX n=1 Tax=Chromobacterium haemolyticum TaxID=394935 RepID=UPI0009D9F0F0|nr:flavin prenyltransferase UbiX [Chromobacterium haemolyticum]OQS44876.1 aromatic acid decarboxylase [Chromobacterium haemolyticum]